MAPHRKTTACLVLALFLAVNAVFAQGTAINAVILSQIKAMPVGGSYSASHVATVRLQSATHFEQGKFFVMPSAAAPSYCSGATYLVFLKTIEALRDSGKLKLDEQALGRLVIRGERDGEGIWGRWNANGPGTARLFFTLQLGSNFAGLERAMPGDFLKIFWTSEVGAAEHGHSVIYLGTETRDGVEHVRFWSSNVPSGYGEKSVPRSKISLMIFSRLEKPENLVRALQMPRFDPYLSHLETRRSSFAEARAKCGF